MEKLKVAVTGGSGFIGSHVVDKLVEAGHEVTVLDHRMAPHRDDVHYEDVDLLDLSSVIEATKGAKHIFHLAAVADVNYAHKYPLYTARLNMLGTANVLEAARHNEPDRVHLASTVWVYNGVPPDAAPLDESTPFHLDGAGHIYTSTKMAAEMLCHNYNQLYGVPFTVLRYGIPYGPRMREALLIPVFIKKALNGEPLTVAGDGKQFRKFVHVSDLARAHVLAMDEVAVNQTYNLEGPREVTVLELAERLRVLVGLHLKIAFVPTRQGDFGGRDVSGDKAARELGWRPEIDFVHGLEDTLGWFCDHWGRGLVVRRPADLKEVK